jgi:uncharacterized protein
MSRPKIIIAGGAGMIGRTLCPWLAHQGWQVVILTRHPVSRAAPEPTNTPENAPGSIHFAPWNGQSPGPWTQHLEGAAAVINLAGRSVNCRYTARNRRAIMDSRILSTRALHASIAQCRQPPALWLNSSTATIYRHTFGDPWDENGPIGPSPEARDAFSIDVAIAWEKEFFFQPTPAMRKIALRTAIVLSHDRQNMLAILHRLARLGLGGPMAGGQQWVSWIHAKDFCRAIEFLIENPRGQALDGPINIASPNPVTNQHMMHLIRQASSRRWGLPAPRWLLEIGAFFLRTETELICKSRRVVPGKLTHAGFAFKFPHMQAALENLLGQRTSHPRAVARPFTPSSWQ